MLKLLLSVLVSLFLVVEPVSAAGAGAGAQAASSKQKRQAVKKPVRKAAAVKAPRKSKRGREVAQVVADDNRGRMVRRVETVRGKRRVSYVIARRAAPALLAIPRRALPAIWPA